MLRFAAALLVLATLYLAVVGIEIDVSPQAEEIAGRLAEALGREVRFTGAIQLEISARPKLRIGGLHIANPQGFGAEEFASLGEARLALNLWPLLWGRIQVEELAGRDAHIRLRVHPDGVNNWLFGKEATPESQRTSETPTGYALPSIDISRVSLQQVNLEYTGANGATHYFDLTSLTARIPSDQPVSISLYGKVEKTFPYQVEFTGGSLAALSRADQPWPVGLSLNFLSSQLTLKGTVSRDSGSIQFDLTTKDLNELQRLLQARLPPVGHTHIAGHVTYAPGKLALTDLTGNMGNTALQGALDVNYGKPRPKVSGQLSLPVLDLRPFMTGQPSPEEAHAQTLAEFGRELAQARFDLHALNEVDADLTLEVGRLLNVPGTVHDARLQAKLAHGRLTMPIRATIADATVSGTAHIDAGKHPARFDVALATRDSSIGNLAGLLFGVPDVRGRLARLDLRASAQGNRGAELMDTLDIQLSAERAELSYGNTSGSRPVRFSLDRFAMTLPQGRSLQGEAHGTLVNNPFHMSLRGPSLTELLHAESVTSDFSLHTGSASAQIHALFQPAARNPVSEVRFSLDAPHSAEVSSWLGINPGADVPVNLHGTLHAHEPGWLLSGLVFQLGHSKISAEIQQTLEQNKPLTRLQLSGQVIDADELKSLLPDAPENPQPAPSLPSSAAMLDLPILPQGISLADADIAVRIHEVVTRSPFTVHNLHFDGRIRNGMMDASPFGADVANTAFTGAILLDLRTQQPRAEFWLGADGMDIGSLLQRLDIARNTRASIDHMRLHLDLHASRLGEILAQSTFAVSFDGGYLELRDANTGGAMHIALDNGELEATPAAPVHLDLNGALDQTPVRIHVETAPAAELLDPTLPIPFKLGASAAAATIELSGDVDRPFSEQDVELALDMRGDRLDKLDRLVHTSLPPWGPWSASGKFHMSAAGYEVSSLLLQVGSSRLTGHGKLDTTTQPRRLNVELAAPTIQVDDFRLGDWSPEEAPPPTPHASAARADEPAADVRQLLSREALQRQDAHLVVRMEQVLSGKDVLGNGTLEATLRAGRANIGPVVVNTPGGTAMLRLDYEPREKDVALNLRAAARQFDYGILARRVDKQSDMRGTFDLDVDVSARARNLSELLRHGKGTIDFAVWPENLKSGLLDLWAVNALVALLPAVDSSAESKVNCAIGQFTLQNGRLSHKRILVDTTRMRVSGKGSADFASEEIRFYMQPRAKTPQFLSFPLPVELSGSFDDFSVGVRPGDVVETTGQFVTSLVWVPLQRLFGKTLPADGSDVCRLK